MLLLLAWQYVLHVVHVFYDAASVCMAICVTCSTCISWCCIFLHGRVVFCITWCQFSPSWEPAFSAMMTSTASRWSTKPWRPSSLSWSRLGNVTYSFPKADVGRHVSLTQSAVSCVVCDWVWAMALCALRVWCDNSHTLSSFLPPARRRSPARSLVAPGRPWTPSSCRSPMSSKCLWMLFPMYRCIAGSLSSPGCYPLWALRTTFMWHWACWQRRVWF